ncbi:MAG: phosphate ABC transporter ATP-binding protein [Thaumarchaeota archaeon]|nr:phosphate ABC transporter ATP-binding protein [Nitrososphaerota archaeon]
MMLKLENVCRSFSGRMALRNASLSVNKGEILAIIGPSGAGKTTLLRLVNLLIQPTSGLILFNDVNTSGDDKHQRSLRRQMSLVLQYPALFDTTVFNNVALGLKIRGCPETVIKEKVDNMLAVVGLSGFEKRMVKTLSGGEAQRIALARALVTEPKLLLLDEPTSNLDPKNVSIIEDIVRAANTKSQVTVVLATHNLNQAKRLAQRVAFILDGEIVEEGASKEIFEQPKDERTATYVDGRMIY